MPPTNRATWLTAKQSPIYVVDSAPYTPPSANEIVIKSKAIAINPADYIVQRIGVLITEYPAILGCDVAGEVIEVDASLAELYKIGDRVIGAANCLARKDGAYCYSAFQEYVVLKAPFIAKLPKEVAFEDAVVLPLGINTAASCLFMSQTLGLAAPSLSEMKEGQGKTVLIWGASSSVGSCGVQMAIQAGYEVVGVASKRNHEMVKSLGATACFDQSNGTLVDDVVRDLKGKEVVGAYSAINSDEALNTICEILDKSGGRKLLASVMPGAEAKGTKGVKIVTNFAAQADMVSGGAGMRVWQWLEKAMEEKKIKYMPHSAVVGKGLVDVQKAVDLLAKGVSAKKLVVTI